MADFTTTPKNPIQWVAPPPEERTAQAYELSIGDGFLLEIGSGYNLTIQPARAGTVWTDTTKTTGASQWPQTSDADTLYLDIGDGFDLLIGNGYKLDIKGVRQETTWTPITRVPTNY